MIKNILIGIFLLLTNVQSDFLRDDVKEIVNDTSSFLMWQDNIDSKKVEKEWQEAIDYCEDLNFAGYDDWRLPNFNELYCIGDRSKNNPAIKGAFVNVGSTFYWSSTTLAYYYSKSYDTAWGLFCYNGTAGYTEKYHEGYVRCVRDR